MENVVLNHTPPSIENMADVSQIFNESFFFLFFSETLLSSDLNEIGMICVSKRILPNNNKNMLMHFFCMTFLY